jgi:hypothetical protein
MAKFKDLTEGSILGESQYYVVEKIAGDKVQLKAASGSIVVDKGYVETYLNSAEQFSKEEDVNKTQLAELFINNPRIVMSVAFYKQNKVKTKKAFNEEKAAKIAEIATAPMGKVESLLNNLIDNPILPYVPGELRVMKGRHYGEIDDLGRMKFVDMEAADGNLRQVDPRTLLWLCVNDVKYNLK